MLIGGMDESYRWILDAPVRGLSVMFMDDKPDIPNRLASFMNFSSYSDAELSNRWGVDIRQEYNDYLSACPYAGVAYPASFAEFIWETADLNEADKRMRDDKATNERLEIVSGVASLFVVTATVTQVIQSGSAALSSIGTQLNGASGGFSAGAGNAFNQMGSMFSSVINSGGWQFATANGAAISNAALSQSTGLSLDKVAMLMSSLTASMPLAQMSAAQITDMASLIATNGLSGAQNVANSITESAGEILDSITSSNGDVTTADNSAVNATGQAGANGGSAVGGEGGGTANGSEPTPPPGKEGENKSVRDELLDTVENNNLKNAINEIYRPGATTGDGGLADAVRHEISTGELVGVKSHIQKAIERVKNLKNIIEKQPLSQSDLEIANRLLTDLKNALGGK